MPRHHDQDRERKRSRSPHEPGHDRDTKKRRSRSPRRHRSHHDHETKPVRLPFKQQPLRKHDLDSYRTLFADYLDIQKRIDIDTLETDEVKGRWKSFLGKWNRGELAEGWYDPGTKRRADERQREPVAFPDDRVARKPLEATKDSIEQAAGDEDDDGDEDDGIGPALPSSTSRAGPAIPTLDDLQHQSELADEDREAHRADLRYERKMDRKDQKERLDELAPRADPGSRERQMEKKREVGVANRGFAEARDSGTVEVAENELMGDDGIGAYKAQLKAKERQKNEREIRKEEVLRARAAEREERFAEHRKKEDKTMDMLRALAQQRYGDSK